MDSKEQFFTFTKVPEDIVAATEGRIIVGTRFSIISEINMSSLSYPNHIKHGKTDDGLTLYIKSGDGKVGFIVDMGEHTLFNGEELAPDTIAWEPVAPASGAKLEPGKHFKFVRVSGGAAAATGGSVNVGRTFSCTNYYNQFPVLSRPDLSQIQEVQVLTDNGLHLKITPFFDKGDFGFGYITVLGEKFDVAWGPAVAPASGGAAVAPASSEAAVAPMSSTQPGLGSLVFTKVPPKVSTYICPGDILIISSDIMNRGMSYPNHIIEGRTIDDKYEVHLKPYAPKKVGIEIWNATGNAKQQLFAGEFEPWDAIQWEKRRRSSDDDGGGPGRSQLTAAPGPSNVELCVKTPGKYICL